MNNLRPAITPTENKIFDLQLRYNAQEITTQEWIQELDELVPECPEANKGLLELALWDAHSAKELYIWAC